MFVGFGVGVVDETGDVLGSGREAGEIEVRAAYEGAAIGGRRRGEAVGAEFFSDEIVDGFRGGPERLQGPPALLGPGGAGVDPLGEGFLIGGGEGTVGRHLAELDTAEQPGQAGFEGGFAGGEIDAGGLCFGVMAVDATAREEGRRVDGEVGGEAQAGRS